MNAQQIKQNIKIVDFLASKGINPDEIKKNGTDYWYKSPLREEKKASFHVDSIKNWWYDQGEGKGGTIIELIMLMYSITDISEVIKIAQNKIESADLKQVTYTKKYETIEIESQNTEYLFSELTDERLMKYVKERNINIELIKNYCSEVKYKKNNKQKDYYHNIAFRNDSNGYELSAPYYDKVEKKSKNFKACISPKDITTIEGTNHEQVILFEGFFDFFSYLTYFKKKILDTDVIVLNSTSLINKAVIKLKEHNYKIIHLYFDTDTAGWGASKKITDLFPCAENLSVLLFPGIKDFNLFLMNEKYHEYRNRWS